MVIFSLHIIYDFACSAGVFFGRANVFARESAILKLPEERRKWGESKGAEGGRENRKPPPHLAFFCRRTYPKGYEHEQGFAQPKYACTAGYL